MATSGSAAFFAALAARIEPLGGKARGMRLTAEDWNSLVGAMVDALLKIGHAQDETKAYLDQAYAPADHEHPSEVTTLWLEPELRNQVATGEALPNRRALATMQRTIASLQSEIGRLSERIGQLERSGPGPFVRFTGFDEIKTRLEAVEELRSTTDRIIKTQSSFKQDIEALVELRGQLTDSNDAPIDIAGLAGRVAELDALRDRLKGVDGQPLALKDLQMQIFQLSDRPGAGGDFDVRFAGIRADLVKISEEAEERQQTLRSELSNVSSQAVAELRNRLDQAVTDNRSALEAATELVRATETRLAAGFTSEIGAARTALMATLRQQAGEAVDERLTGVDARIEGLISTRTTELRTKLVDEIGKPLETRLAQGLTEATGRLDTKFAGIEARVRAATDSIPQELTKGLTSVETNLQARVDSRFTAKATELSQSLAGQVEQKVAAGINAGLIEVRTAASQTVTDRLANLDARIAASVTSATRDLPDRIATTVDTRLQQVNIPGQIAAANRQLDTELRREIATTAANVQSINSTALNSAMINLRTDLAARPPADFRTTDLRTTDLRTTEHRVQPDLRGRPGPGG